MTTILNETYEAEFDYATLDPDIASKAKDAVPATRSISARMRSLAWAVKLRRRGRSINSGDAATGPGTIVGLRPSSVPGPVSVEDSVSMFGITTRRCSYALKAKLPGGRCLTIVGTEGSAPRRPRPGRSCPPGSGRRVDADRHRLSGCRHAEPAVAGSARCGPVR